MVNFETLFCEEQSITSSPIFRGEKFEEWKKMMEFFLKMDYGLCYIVDECPFVPMISDSSSDKEVCVLRPKIRNELDENDKQSLRLNAKVIYIMYNVLDLKKSSRIKDCKDAHKI